MELWVKFEVLVYYGRAADFFWKSSPPKNFAVQNPKDLRFYFSTQNFDNSSKSYREIDFLTVECKNFPAARAQFPSLYTCDAVFINGPGYIPNLPNRVILVRSGTRNYISISYTLSLFAGDSKTGFDYFEWLFFESWFVRIPLQIVRLRILEIIIRATVGCQVD